MTKLRRKFHILMAGCCILLLLCGFFALCIGQFPITPRELVSEFTGNSAGGNVHTVLWQIRLPRILLAMAAGCGLAVSGAAFQSLFSNPLATPDTLGTANGASFGAALGILAGFPSFGIQFLSLLCGVAAVLLVFLVTRSRQRQRSMMTVILGGLVISALFSSLLSLVKYTADPQDVLPVITFWLMGSLTGTTMHSFLLGLPFILGGTVLLYLLRFRMNALSLPEEEARSLGLNLPLVRGLVIAAAAAVTASVVSMCGVIGWVGLLVPHVVRMIVGSDNRRVIPSCMAAGALFLLLVDTAARCLTAAEIPVSILTSVVGAPVFLVLLRKTGGIRL